MRGETGRLQRTGRVAAAIALGAQLVALAHVLLVRHTTCAEHGEAAHGSVASSNPAAPQPAQSTVAPLEAAAHGADEHCLVWATTRRDDVGLVPAAVIDIPAPDARRISAAASVALSAARAPLSFAPKTSPPVAS